MGEPQLDWNEVYRDSGFVPDDSRNDLLSVTRETLSLSINALIAQQREDAYHNVRAAIEEIRAALAAASEEG